MDIKEYLERMKAIQSSILFFINKGDNYEELYHNIIQQINDAKFSTNRQDLKALLYLLSKILNNHYRNPNFFEKIKRIFKNFANNIKKFFTNIEIYKIFKKCPRFLLFLYEEDIITLNDELLNIMSDTNIAYLSPKIAHQKKIIEKIPENFYEKQKIGENDDYLNEIIRKDLIEEFITYVNKKSYPLHSDINPSIFETNSFLIKQENTTLIEYASFFGSTQIFKYLYKNDVELTPSLWIYGIHSDNPEIINILEENQIKPPNDSYDLCLKESIKCHHIDITNYIQSNFMNDYIDDVDPFENYRKNIISYCFHFYNFLFFPLQIDLKIIFYYACQYDYYKIVEYFLKYINIDINEKIIFNHFYYFNTI